MAHLNMQNFLPILFSIPFFVATMGCALSGSSGESESRNFEIQKTASMQYEVMPENYSSQPLPKQESEAIRKLEKEKTEDSNVVQSEYWKAKKKFYQYLMTQDQKNESYRQEYEHAQGEDNKSKEKALLEQLDRVSPKDFEFWKVRQAFYLQLMFLNPSNVDYKKGYETALLGELEQVAYDDWWRQMDLYEKLLTLAPKNEHYKKGYKLSERSKTDKEPVHLSMTKWGKTGFGSIMVADFEIENNSLHNMKDFKVSCIYGGNSGTVIDRNTKTIYEIVEAKSTKTIKDFQMGFIQSQVNSARCRLIDKIVVK